MMSWSSPRVSFNAISVLPQRPPMPKHVLPLPKHIHVQTQLPKNLSCNVITLDELMGELPVLEPLKPEITHLTRRERHFKPAHLEVGNGIDLGLKPENFIPCSQTVRGYENSTRKVLCIIVLPITMGPSTHSVEFQLLDIPAGYNLLLGCPWIHSTRVLPSSLQQKVKFPWNCNIVSMREDRQNSPDNSTALPVLQIQKDEEGFPLSSFMLEQVHNISMGPPVKEYFPLYFVQYNNVCVAEFMRKVQYFPSIGLGKRQQGVTKFKILTNNEHTSELDYEPAKANYTERAARVRERVRAKLEGRSFDLVKMRPYLKTFNRQFLKLGEEFPFYGFPELWFDDKTKQRTPSFEIFFDYDLINEDESVVLPVIKKKTDWVEQFGSGDIATLWVDEVCKKECGWSDYQDVGAVVQLVMG